MTERERVLRAMRAAADMVREGKARADEVPLAIATACDSEGISPQQYRRVVDGDDVLADLEHHAIEDAITGDVDPGPYAAISREAPSGRPGELSQSIEHPIPPWWG